MNDMTLYLIIALVPLAGSLIAGLFGNKIGRLKRAYGYDTRCRCICRAVGLCAVGIPQWQPYQV